MNVNFLKSLIPSLIQKIGDINKVVVDLLDKEQEKHSDLFVYMIVKADDKALIKGVVIDEQGKITEKNIKQNDNEVSCIEITELLKNLLNNV